MIVCNGIVGVCLLWGGARHHEQGFQVRGASAALAVLAALTTLTLVMPNLATSLPGPAFSTSQLIFAGIVSLVLYGSFVFIQTVRHRDYFLPEADDEEGACAAALEQDGRRQRRPVARRPRRRRGPREVSDADTGGRTGLARRPKPWSELLSRPLVLLPECLAALRAARANRLQTSLNLALGSALASIGLTIPAVAVVSIVLASR